MPTKPAEIAPAVEEQGPGVADAAQAIESLLFADDDGLLDEEDAEELDTDKPTEELEADEDEEPAEEAVEADEDVTEAEEADETVEDDTPIDSLVALAEATEVPIEDILANVKHTIGETEVPLSEMVASYADKAERDETHRFVSETARESATAYEKQSTILAQTMQTIEKFVSSDMETAEMQALRASDPAEWTARITEAGQKVQSLRGLREELAAGYDQHVQAERQKFFELEGQKLRSDIPGWGSEKLQTALTVVKGLGFSDEEVSHIADSRLMKAATEMHELRAENKALKAAASTANAAAKKVKKVVPKKTTLKPGARTAEAGAKGIERKNMVSLKRRLAKSNRVDDAAKVIEMMMS